MLTQQCHDNTMGCDSCFCSNLTLADANPPGSRVNNTPFRHQVDGQECLQPPDPVSHHIVLKTRISSQLVWSISESLATVSVVVPIRVTIAVQPNLANGSHIARSHTFREIATQIFADCAATTPRRGTLASRDGVEPSRLRRDSTTSPAPRRGYPLSDVVPSPYVAFQHHPIEYY